MAKGREKIVSDAIGEMTDASRLFGPEGIEAAKLRIDIERLKLEKERLESGIAGASSANPEILTFKLGTVCIVSAVCLLFGGIIGFTTGLDIGVRRSPIPQKVLVSKQFLRIFESPPPSPPPAPRDFPPWFPRKTKGVPSDLIVVR